MSGPTSPFIASVVFTGMESYRIVCYTGNYIIPFNQISSKRLFTGTMSDDDSISGDEKSWGTFREKVIYEESKQVMEAQKSDITDMDDKALRTVRITAVLLAAGATGIEIIGMDNINESLALASVGAFLLSMIFGVIVYNESDELVGPKAWYIEKMRENSFKQDWDDDFLYQLEGWIKDNQDIVEFNGYILMFCQIFFLTGVVLGVASLLSLEVTQAIIGIVGIIGIMIASFWLIRQRLA